MFPNKPAGSTIEEREGSEGIVLCWSGPSDGAGRWFGAAFVTFWLCGWTVGGITAAACFLAGTGAILSDLFLLAWLGGWALGEGWALWCLCHLVRPPRPESVTLGPDTFRYDPGHAPTAQPQPALQNGATGDSRPQRPIEIPRRELQEFVLDRVGERQRLTFDRGADRIEIGTCLREPEREWLGAVLESWRQSR